MAWITWVGAVLVLLGVVYSAYAAIYRGRMSNPHSSPTAVRTLEPKQSGIPALGFKANWPGIALVVGGIAIFLVGYLGFAG